MLFFHLRLEKPRPPFVVAFLFGEFVMAEQTFDNPKQQLAGLSLLLSVTGIAFGFLIGLIGFFTESNTTKTAFFAFASVEMAAIVCGVISWPHALGKAGTLIAGFLLLASLLLLA